VPPRAICAESRHPAQNRAFADYLPAPSGASKRRAFCRPKSNVKLAFSGGVSDIGGEFATRSLHGNLAFDKTAISFYIPHNRRIL
jgi:hypothetical protein